MLNIGRALRNERLAQNKIQREWIKRCTYFRISIFGDRK